MSYLNKIKKFIFENWFPLLLIILFISLCLFFKLDYFNRLLIDIKILFLNFIYYFVNLFNPDVQFPSQVLDTLKQSSSSESLLSLIPEDVIQFFNLIGNSFTLIFKKDYIKYNIMQLLNNISKLSLIASLLTLFIPLVYLIKVSIFKEKEFSRNECSFLYKLWIKFYNKILDPIIKFIKKLICSCNKNYFKLLFILCLLYYFQLYSIFLNILSYYFYFVSKIDFNALWECFFVVLIQLLPIFIKVPLFIWLLLGYLFLNWFRTKIAYSILESHELQNLGFVKGLGIITLINGGPETGKTKTMTDMGITAEHLFREQALDILNEIRNLFPNFRFDLFEKHLDHLIRLHLIKNPVDCEKYVLKNLQLNISHIPVFGYECFFFYDFDKYGFEFDNGNIYENLFDDLIDYAKAYFVYTNNFALLSSNYPIRIDPIRYDSYFGHRIEWIYDYFSKTKDESYSYYSKVIDYDSMRLGKKIKPDNPHNGLTMGYSICLTEVGKERGNSLENQEIKKSTSETNVKNDGFTDYLRVGRHPLTIRHRSFVKIFMDEQRCSSVGVALSGISESILTIDKNLISSEFALPFFELEDLISNLILSKIDSFFNKYYSMRNDRNLFILFINFIETKLNRKITFIHNTFDYKKIKFYMQNGTLKDVENNVEKSVYFLSNKKIHSNRYASDYLRTFFDESAKYSLCGFSDLDEYSNLYPSWDDFDKMNSYFSEKLKSEMDSLINSNSFDKKEFK